MSGGRDMVRTSETDLDFESLDIRPDAGVFDFDIIFLAHLG